MTEPTPEKTPYRDIADILRGEIENGEHPRGEKLPTAKQLSGRWNVSTTTVHRAFGVLQQEGLVTIEPGRGVYVRKWTPILRDANERLAAKQWGSGHSIWDADLRGRKMNVETSTDLTKDAPAAVREILDCETYLVRDRVFTVERERVQLARSYLDAGLVIGTAIEGVDTGAGGTFARLGELGVAPSRFREDIRVRRPLPGEAERLDIGANRYVIEIMRENATEDQRVVEVTHMVLVADAYVLRYHMHS